MDKTEYYRSLDPQRRKCENGKAAGQNRLNSFRPRHSAQCRRDCRLAKIDAEAIE